REMMTQGTLLIAKDSATHVATITINRADSLNTLTPGFFEDFDRALGELQADEAVRCVVIIGAGDRAFSAGADLTSFTEVSKAFKVWRSSRRSQEVFLRLANFPKPTVAAKAVENEAFAAEVRALSEKLAKQAPVAIQLAKVLLNRATDTPVDAALEMEAMAFGLVTSSEDVFEGLQAFLEKREPKFKGE